MKLIKTALLSAALMFLGTLALAEGKLSVVATNFPCYDFARQVAGDAAQVTMLIHPGGEVHAYDPTPADVRLIEQADLFVYIGGESDAWVDSLLAGFDGGQGPARLRMMDSVSLLEEEGDHDHDYDSGAAPEYDEHIWTSPVNARRMVEAMGEAISSIDPDNADTYAAAAGAYAAQIDGIDAAIRDVVANGARRELVFADRFPFLYFAREYGLECTAAFSSCTADAEPTPQILMKLIRKVAEDHLSVVYTIEMSTGQVARTVAEETGARILTLHSLQTVTQDEFEAGESYVSVMWKNVEALKEGLM